MTEIKDLFDRVVVSSTDWTDFSAYLDGVVQEQPWYHLEMEAPECPPDQL